MTRALEDDHGDVADLPAEGTRDRAEVLRRSGGDVDLARGDRPDAQLLHVRVGGVGQPALFRGGEHGDRPGLAVGDEVGALERVDRDVDRRHVRPAAVPPSDLLADVEHRGFVALALADDDATGEVDLVHRPAHGLGGQLVRAVPIAATHRPCRGDGRLLGDPDHLEREELFHRLLCRQAGVPISASHQCRKWRRPVKTIAM